MGDLRNQAYQRPYQGPYQGCRWRLNWETKTKFAFVSAVQLLQRARFSKLLGVYETS